MIVLGVLRCVLREKHTELLERRDIIIIFISLHLPGTPNLFDLVLFSNVIITLLLVEFFSLHLSGNSIYGIM